MNTHSEPDAGRSTPASPTDARFFAHSDGFLVCGAGERPLTVLIDSRTFVRDCLSASLSAADATSDFLTFDNIQEWRNSALPERTSLVLFWANDLLSIAELGQQLAELKALDLGIPFAVMSDEENPAALSELIANGARAFLPTTLSLNIIVKALHLVQSGGFYIPAQCLVAMPHDNALNAPANLSGLFSPRQLAVIRAMRKGMSNKIIAYELSMCESTVKVHVRNIMKKLKAKNRTEVAFITQQMFPKD